MCDVEPQTDAENTDASGSAAATIEPARAAPVVRARGTGPSREYGWEVATKVHEVPSPVPRPVEQPQLHLRPRRGGSRAPHSPANPPLAGPSDTARDLRGLVHIDAGPFAGVQELRAFEDLLASLPGVRDVHLHTLERDHARYELRAEQPATVLAALQDVTHAPLEVVRIALS